MGLDIIVEDLLTSVMRLGGKESRHVGFCVIKHFGPDLG